MSDHDEANPPPNEEHEPTSSTEAAPPPDADQQIANLPPVLPRIDSPTEAALAAWVENMPEEIYHADKAAVSSTGLKKLINDTPAHFYEAWSHPHVEDDDEETNAQRLGTLLHLALLQPKLYAERVVLSKKFDRRTKEGKAGAAAFEKELPNKAIVVEKEEKAMVEAMAMSVLAHPIAGSLIRSPHLRRELTGYFTCPASRVRCRVRFDGYEVTPDGARTILDIKTIHSVRTDDIQRAIEKWNYANQSITYIEAAAVIDQIPVTDPLPIYVWIFIEKPRPHSVRVFYPDEQMLADAADARVRAMAQLATCIQSGKWPGHDESAQPISRPAWAQRKQR